MKILKCSDAQMIIILKQAENDVPISSLCCEHGMNSVNLSKWCSKYSGLEASLSACMKYLEEVNKRLKKMCAEKCKEVEAVHLDYTEPRGKIHSNERMFLKPKALVPANSNEWIQAQASELVRCSNRRSYAERK